ncbi:MAG TPA: ParA family protein [Candidatus Limnocylindrales bacterium]|jgi:chromosome partitioning protein
MRTIAVINRKGGCGKSTTAVNVAAALGEVGRRALVIDLDPQGTASSWLGPGPTEDRDMFDAFVGTRELIDLAITSRAARVDLVPASSWLVTAEQTLQVDLALGAIRALERLPDEWDVVLVDCPPTLGYLGSAALCGCHEALLPTEPHALGLAGIADVLAEMDRIRGRLNPGLVLTGIVVDRASHTRHAREVINDLRTEHGDDVLLPTIRVSIRVAEAAAAGLPVTAYVPDAAVSHDVRAVAADVLRRDPDNGHKQESSNGGWRGIMGRLVGAGA